MTSLEIAELTGKQHKNVMQAIRNMEPAWEKVTGLKFQLCEKSYLLANGVTKKQPFYQLTKTECLYIATKFNDEARAKLVLRWQELEMEEGFATPHSALQRRRKMSDVRCLPEPKKILALADEIIGEGLRMMKEPAEDTLTATQVAKTFNMSVYDFNCVVRDMGKEQQGQVSVSPNKEERLKIDNYEEVYISNTLDYCNRSCFVFFTFLVYWN